jgi:nucleoside-diphosphate-sugar epimerase
MIQHQHPQPKAPSRVVVLGGSGFLGRYLVNHLRCEGVATVSVSSQEIDLTSPTSVEQLKVLLHEGDALVFASCLAPRMGRDIRTAMRNLAMGEHVCAALQQKPCGHVVYISSDAVYADEETLVRENSRCEPSSYYGLAHFFRERAIRNTADAAKTPWLIVRPTLLYGEGDTHNSYSVNRFMRQAAENGVIKVFGNGEEKRDHLHIADAARFLSLCLFHKSTGIVNLVTGQSPSYLEVAELCAAQAGRPVTIERLPRSGPITHRHFDPTALLTAFPTLRLWSVAEGIARYHSQRAAA